MKFPHLPITNVADHKCILLLFAIANLGNVQAATDAVNQPMDEAELQRFRDSFDEDTLRSLFGEGASIVALAELDRNAVTGSRSYGIYLNGSFLERRVVQIEVQNGRYVVLIPASLLLGMPFDIENPDLPEGLRTLSRDEMLEVEEVQALLPGASVTLNTLSQRVDFTIPKVWFRKKFGNIAPLALWDWGRNALIMNYDLNAQHSRTDGIKRSHFYGALNSSLHLGAWRIVGSGSVSVDQSDHLDRQENFERRELYATRVWGESQTRLKFGEFTTSSYFTQGIRIKGAELRLDPTMLDRDELDFVPVITGTASTQARVTVRQQGSIIYERYVSPGPFVLENIPNISSSGDLEVVVTEADGTERRFTVPFTTNGRQLRTGKAKWTVAAGYFDGYYTDSSRPEVITFDGGWGAPLNTTIYGGGILTSDYQNLRTGLAFMVPHTGALNLEWVHSQDRTENALGTGNGIALGFTRYVQQTGSYISARYEKATSGVLTTIDEAYANDSLAQYWWRPTEQQWQLALSQSMGQLGSINLSYDRRDVRDGQSIDNLSAAWTTSVKNVSVTLSVQKSSQQDTYGIQDDWTAAVTLRIPLDVFTGKSAHSRHNISLGANRNTDGSWSEQASLSGSALEDSRLSYSLQAAHSEGRDNRYYGSVQYRANRADWSLMASTGADAHSITGSVRGGLIAFDEGVYLTREVSGPSVLATFPNVPEAEMRYRIHSTKVDGGVFVTSLNNYERNELSVDVNKLPNNVSLPEYIKHVIPADDALIVIPFETFRGEQMLARFVTPDGHPPFGSYVRLIDSKQMPVEGMLDEDGTAYFPAVPSEGTFEVQWRTQKGSFKRCRAPYKSGAVQSELVQIKKLICTPLSEK